jgi:hypothetical protein
MKRNLSKVSLVDVGCCISLCRNESLYAQVTQRYCLLQILQSVVFLVCLILQARFYVGLRLIAVRRL